MSSGARAMEGIGGRLSAGVAGAGRSMISTARAQGAQGMATAEQVAKRRAMGGSVLAMGRRMGGKNAARTGGIATGMVAGGAGAAYGMHRRKGSQNYSM